MKTVLLKKGKYFAALALFLLFLAGCIFPYRAASARDTSSAVYDEAGLFRDAEIRELERMAQKYGQKAKVHYYILTQNVYLDNDPYLHVGGIEAYTEELSEEFYDTVAAPAGNKDAVIFTIVMEYRHEDTSARNYTDRYADISGHGYGKKRLDDNRAQMVFDDIKLTLSGGDYAGAMEKAMKISCEYMKYRPGVDPNLLIFRLWFQVLVCLAAGGVIVSCMVYHSGGTVTTNNRTYLDMAHSKILARRDIYLRTTLKKTRKQSNSSGGRHGGGSHSSHHSSHRSRGSHGGGHF